jgi:hypothetical protein
MYIYMTLPLLAPKLLHYSCRLRLPNYIELTTKYDPQRSSIDHTAPHRCNIFKVTCLDDPQRTVGTPRKFGLEGPRTTVPTQRYLSRSKHKQSLNKMQQTCVI